MSLLEIAAKFSNLNVAGFYTKFTGYIIFSLDIDLSLALLVQFNLGRGGSGGLSKTLSHVLELAGKIGPLPLSLSASLPLRLQFFLQLLDMSLVLLDDGIREDVISAKDAAYEDGLIP